MLGRISPLDLSVASILEIVNKLIKVEEKGYSEALSEARDFGDVIKVLFEKARLSPTSKRITLERVSHTFKEIAETKGTGARRKKKEMLLDLLVDSTPLEARYIAKNVIEFPFDKNFAILKSNYAARYL